LAFSPRVLVQVLTGAARALQHLHSLTPPLHHGHVSLDTIFLPDRVTAMGDLLGLKLGGVYPCSGCPVPVEGGPCAPPSSSSLDHDAPADMLDLGLTTAQCVLACWPPLDTAPCTCVVPRAVGAVVAEARARLLHTGDSLAAGLAALVAGCCHPDPLARLSAGEVVGLGTALTQGPCPSLHYDALPRPPGPVGSDSGGPGEGAAGDGDANDADDDGGADGEDAELWWHALRTPGPDPHVVLQALDALTVLYTRSPEVDYDATLVAVCSALVQWRGHPGVQAEGLGLMAKLLSWHPVDNGSLEPPYVDSDGVEDAASSGSPGWQGPHCEPQGPPGSAAYLLHVTLPHACTAAVIHASHPGVQAAVCDMMSSVADAHAGLAGMALRGLGPALAHAMATHRGDPRVQSAGLASLRSLAYALPGDTKLTALVPMGHPALTLHCADATTTVVPWWARPCGPCVRWH
jgi:hypothetical protein